LDNIKDDRSGVVSSVFNKGARKPVSALFDAKVGAVTPKAGEVAGKAVSSGKYRILPFGIDIGTSSIKAAQCGLGKDGNLKMLKIARQEFPGNAVFDDKSRDSLMSAALKEFVSENKLKGDCYASMPPGKVNFYFVELPDMPQAEISKALEWEMRQRLGSEDLSGFYYDYIVLNAENKILLNNRTGILVVVAKKTDIKAYLDMLREAGLNPLAIDVQQVSTLALIDTIRKPARNAGVMLLVEFGAGFTYISVICNGEIMSVRPMRVTGNQLTGAVRKALNVEWVEAEKLKRRVGFIPEAGGLPNMTPEDISVSGAIEPLVQDMIRDIEHTFKYFSHQVTRSQVAHFDSIAVSGGTGMLKGFLPYLKEKFGVEIFAPNPFEIFQTDKNMTNVQNAQEMALACALAIRGMGK